MPMPRVDFKGFEKVINNVRAIIKKSGGVYVLYEKGVGFICRRELCSKIRDRMYDEKVSLVGFYKAPLKSSHLVDDLEYELSLQVGKL